MIEAYLVAHTGFVVVWLFMIHFTLKNLNATIEAIEMPKLDVPELKFDNLSRDRLVQNLHLTADNWDKENKSQTQKMEIYIKELDRVMLLLKEAQKNENQAKRGATAGIKGG